MSHPSWQFPYDETAYDPDRDCCMCGEEILCKDELVVRGKDEVAHLCCVPDEPKERIQ